MHGRSRCVLATSLGFATGLLMGFGLALVWAPPRLSRTPLESDGRPDTTSRRGRGLAQKQDSGTTGHSSSRKRTARGSGPKKGSGRSS